MISAMEALARLREGNLRFARNQSSAVALDPARRAALVEGQEPFAIVLGCSDSRVPAELVFDQGLRDSRGTCAPSWTAFLASGFAVVNAACVAFGVCCS